MAAPMTAKLLIVDDNPVDRELAVRSVRSLESLEVLEAENGEQALALLAEHAPDLVLTDLRMPEMDGLTLVQQVRERFPLVPVILMTAQGSEQIAARALQAGAASYVPKADLPKFLAEAVQQQLAMSLARRERAGVLSYLRSSEVRFELVTDPGLISPLVAYLQDDLVRTGFGDDQIRSQIGIALFEALSNAMIHGNLEVSSELRGEGSEPYHRLIEERRQAEPWASRRVYCRAERSAAGVGYVVRDEGPGFDRSSYPDPTDAGNMLKAQGRGLFLIHAFMDEVEYNEAGNELRLFKRAPG